MKKTLTSLLCLTMACLALAGCSDNSEPFEEKSYCFACSSFRVEERADLDKPSALCRSAAQTHSPFWESSQHSTIACPSDSSSSLMLCLPCRSREWYSCLNVQSRVASNQNRSFL